MSFYGKCFLGKLSFIYTSHKYLYYTELKKTFLIASYLLSIPIFILDYLLILL